VTKVSRVIFRGLKNVEIWRPRIANCRVCPCSFKPKFEIFSQKEGYLSSENLLKPSNRKDCRGVVSAEVLKKTGISIERHENFSDRVSNPCASNIYNLASLYTMIEGISQKTPEKQKQHTERLTRITIEISPHPRLQAKLREENLLSNPLILPLLSVLQSLSYEEDR